MEGVAVSCCGSFNLHLTQGYGKLGFVPSQWQAAPIYNMLTAFLVISMQGRMSPHRKLSSKGTWIDGRERQTANPEHHASTDCVNLLFSLSDKYLGSFYTHIFTTQTFVNIHIHCLGPSRLFWFGLNLSALNCIELIVVGNGKKNSQGTATDLELRGLEVRLLWSNMLLSISWAAVTPHF